LAIEALVVGVERALNVQQNFLSWHFLHMRFNASRILMCVSTVPKMLGEFVSTSHAAMRMTPVGMVQGKVSVGDP
jgi:hypothetical protein